MVRGVTLSRALRNLGAILDAAGSDTGSVVKATVYLADIADAALVAGAWQDAFSPPYPALTVVAVRGMPLDAAVEIECVAVVRSEGGASA